MVEQSFISIFSSKLDHLKSEKGQKRSRYQSWCHFAVFMIFKNAILELEKMQIPVGAHFSASFQFLQKCKIQNQKFSAIEPVAKSEITEIALFAVFCGFAPCPQPRAINRRRYQIFCILMKICCNKDLPIGTGRARS